MSNLYSEDFRIGEIKNSSRYASISYNKTKKTDKDTVRAMSNEDRKDHTDNAGNLKNITEINTDTNADNNYNIRNGRIITFHMKMFLCAQIVLCIIFTFMALEFSKKPENYYNAKKIYGAIQNSREIHKLEETLITAKNDFLNKNKTSDENKPKE